MPSSVEANAARELKSLLDRTEGEPRGGSGDKGMVFNTDLTQALELGFLLELAECMVVSGLARKESRGAHARPYDYPERDDENSCGTRS